MIGTKRHFKRIFINYDALHKGFNQACRSLIGVESCHFKTAFGWVLLSAVAINANNGIFPLAVANCEVENKDSWCWFFRLLKEYTGS